MSDDECGVGSFWAPGNFKRTTKRIEDGNKLCSDLVFMISERAEIEKNYAKQLQSWSHKWENMIEKGPEYGTMQTACESVLLEAKQLSTLHNSIRDDLINDVVNNKVKVWQKENYHKSMMNQLKEKKEMDENFKKVQKPWVKLFNKVNKAKSDYHTACKNERSAIHNQRNLTADNPTPEQCKKLQDRVNRCKEQVETSRQTYKISLDELNSDNGRYMEEMTLVFNKCQKMESLRFEAFKGILMAFHKSLNITKDEYIKNIYADFQNHIQQVDIDSDLRYWSDTHGVGMKMDWPEYQEYCEELRDISATSTVMSGMKKSKNSSTSNGGFVGVSSGDNVVTLIHQRHVGDDVEDNNTDTKINRSNSNGAPESNRERCNEHSNGGDDVRTSVGNRSPKHESASSTINGGSSTSSTLSQSNNDWSCPGVKVRALYDYEPVEDDEISLKEGEILDKIEEEDEQGWCKGRKSNRVGLYPADYVENV